MIISIGAEKTPDRIQPPFIMKTFNEMGNQESPTPNKAIYNKPSAHILLHGEKVKLFL